MQWVFVEHLVSVRDKAQEKQSLEISLSNCYKLDTVEVNWICNS